MKDAVVFAEPVLVRLHHRGRRTFQLYPSNAGGERFKIRVPDPAAGQLHQLAPVPREGQLENQTDDAVVVILDLSFQAFAGLQDHRLNPLQNGRPLVANISGRGMLEAGLHRSGADNLAQLVQPDFFANVKLHEHPQTTMERGFRDRFLADLSGNVNHDKRGCAFTFHRYPKRAGKRACRGACDLLTNLSIFPDWGQSGEIGRKLLILKRNTRIVGDPIPRKGFRQPLLLPVLDPSASSRAPPPPAFDGPCPAPDTAQEFPLDLLRAPSE